MPYDPCGSLRLEGSEILRRLAKEIGVRPEALRAALRDYILAQEGI